MNYAEMDKYDWDGIALLLEVVNKSAGHPKLKNITNAALAMLDAIANRPVEAEAPEPVEPPIGNALSERRV